MEIEKQIKEYLRCLDESLDILSLHKEGELIGLPSWALSTRTITIGVAGNDGIVLKVVPDKALDDDVVNILEIKSVEQIRDLFAQLGYDGPPIERLDENFFALWGDTVMYSADNPLLPPALDNKCLLGLGRKKGFQSIFNVENAKQDAIDFWNKRRLPKTHSSYVVELKTILGKFHALIKRKAFLERRIHRFIYEHKNVLLPPHKRCFFEHTLYYGTDSCKADFVLEREQGLSSLLIELESPVHAVFTKTMDLTAPANHARQQISKWVLFIDSDAVRNAS
ncbi:MAG TPA: hypothetical protein VMU21_00305 [Thermodesulfovibrionales bacterium]|nr:hypothetical protein [Thermodesulfovibrionales bacterium]